MLCLTWSAPAAEQPAREGRAERVVVLAPAAADVLERLGMGDSVVGVTDSVAEFPHAARVGSHRNPVIESLAALKPTLLVTPSWFDASLSERLNAEIFIYNPQSLDTIIAAIHSLASRLGKEREGDELADTLQGILDGLSQPSHTSSVLYEVRATPLSMARKDTVIADLLERAGMRYAYEGNAGMLSVEYLLARQPDVYIYQVGPMNRNPVPPRERNGWGSLRSCIVEVDELQFARANTRMFDTLQKLNAALAAGTLCGTDAIHSMGRAEK